MSQLPTLCEVAYERPIWWSNGDSVPYRFRFLSDHKFRDGPPLSYSLDSQLGYADAVTIGCRTPLSFFGRPGALSASPEHHLPSSRAQSLPPHAYGAGGHVNTADDADIYNSLSFHSRRKERAKTAPCHPLMNGKNKELLSDDMEDEHSDDEENRLIWVPSLNAWIDEKKSLNPVPYTSFVSSVNLLSRGPGANIEHCGELPLIPCERFSSHMTTHEAAIKALRHHESERLLKLRQRRDVELRPQQSAPVVVRERKPRDPDQNSSRVRFKKTVPTLPPAPKPAPKEPVQPPTKSPSTADSLKSRERKLADALLKKSKPPDPPKKPPSPPPQPPAEKAPPKPVLPSDSSKKDSAKDKLKENSYNKGKDLSNKNDKSKEKQEQQEVKAKTLQVEETAKKRVGVIKPPPPATKSKPKTTKENNSPKTPRKVSPRKAKPSKKTGPGVSLKKQKLNGNTEPDLGIIPQSPSPPPSAASSESDLEEETKPADQVDAAVNSSQTDQKLSNSEKLNLIPPNPLRGPLEKRVRWREKKKEPPAPVEEPPKGPDMKGGRVGDWLYGDDDFSVPLPEPENENELAKEEPQTQIQDLPPTPSPVVAPVKVHKKPSNRRQLALDQRRRGPRRRDRSYLDDLERMELAEQRRKKAQEMFDKLKNRKTSQEDMEDGIHVRFEDYGFLAKYCIFNKSNIEIFRRAFEAVDENKVGWLSFPDTFIAMRGVNSSLTDAEEEYMYRILEIAGYKATEGSDFKLFAVMCALSHKISSLDTWMRNLIGRVDFKMLEMKLFMCKTLWECNVDAETNKIPLDQLCVELRAGGVSFEHECEVREKLGHLHALDLMDFLTYVPLFILIHESVVLNPLDDTREK